MLTIYQLSDIFFNYDHPNFNACFKALAKNETPAPKEVTAAIGKDAEEFAASYPEFGKSGEWYAQDFLKRL